mgnify:CR=1 FL=1
MFTFFICSLIVSAIALPFHIFINRNERNVYSKDTKLNQIINTTMKKYKGIALILMSLLNGVAWIYMALSTYISGNYSGTSFFVYIFVQILNVFGLIIPLFLAQQRKKELLASDTAPIYVDDDEYWKYGFYYNPNDRHMLVKNRLYDMNYAFNYASRGAQVLVGILTVFITASIIFTVAVPVSYTHLTLPTT